MLTKTIIPDLLNGHKFELPDRSEVAMVVGMVDVDGKGPAVFTKFARGDATDIMLVKATPKQLWFCPRAELDVKKNSRIRINHNEWCDVVNWGLPKGVFRAFCHPTDTEHVVKKMEQRIAVECQKIIEQHVQYRQLVTEWVRKLDE